ncbi:NAD-dependent epimerase/dehydratase family protein [Sphingomonas nostoxanthinifaciens]|uniref:NAD-dependent epimerase/dehydratase family protein n=1 Tax=Sphingomonas nostoxanthinifaciens TaxID=2872652 RepID=UPI001CC21E8F|nr:NAD(P)H-binding protein [Sphingomonas nostoxanthinifaciens]UAK24234.1 NAD(P)H-binding protein [Sphingomonas nostoxanthinifaciens]
MRLAVTGGTGFVGSTLIERALAAGHQVRALARREQPPRAGVAWVPGALDRPASLAALVEGCDAVIHIAGVINGDAAAFAKGNIAGTDAMVAAASAAGIRRFVHVSSLAAREPQLSTYGWSKRESEDPVVAAGGDWTIIRPPAIYGPRDREMLELFRWARRRVVPLPPGVRLSLIAVEDLADLMLVCLDASASFNRLYEPDDGRSGGWPAPELARAIGQAVGRRVLPLSIPKVLLLAGSWADRTIRRDKAKLTRDRVAYFCHPDWTAAPHARPPADLWQPKIDGATGLAATARWYEQAGWL